MWQHFLYAAGISLAAMFPIINPIGHAPMFQAMTADDTPAFRRKLAGKTALWVTLILIISIFAGKWILIFFGISLDDLRIAGGLLIARSAWGMLGNQSRVTPQEHSAAIDKDDISLTPMATPILAGPGAMSLAVGMSSYGQLPIQYAGYLTGFIIMGLITWISFLFADRIVSFLGVNAAGALNRILGFFILAIGVSLIVTGVRDLFHL